MTTHNATPATFAAVNSAAKAGDMILLALGIYAGFVPVSGVTYSAATTGLAVVNGVINGVDASDVKMYGLASVSVASGTQAQQAAIRSGPQWTVKNVTVRNAAGCGFGVMGRDSTFTDCSAQGCGQIGWGISPKRANEDPLLENVLLKNCSALGNNTLKYNAAWEAGGVKFYRTKGCGVDGGVWANNGGPGIWFDYQNQNFAIRNTEVYGNHGWNQGWAGVGIVSEINPGPGLIENNYVHDNTGDGIAVWEAFGTTIRNNRLVNDNIGWRDMTARAPYRTRDNLVENNQLTNGAVAQPPANANNVVRNNGSGVIVPPTPPTPPAALPADAVEIGLDKNEDIWHKAEFRADGAFVLWWENQRRSETATSFVKRAEIVDGVLWQEAVGGKIWAWNGIGWDAKTAWPAPVDPCAAVVNELKAEIKAHETHVAALLLEIELSNTELASVKQDTASKDRKLAAVRAGLEVP